MVNANAVTCEISLVDESNFDLHGLDGFVRTQQVTEVIRLVGGSYRAVSAPFTDDWTPMRKRVKAAEMLSGDYITWGAFDGGRLIGFAMLEKELRGTRLVLDSFHVSQEYRHHGLGRRLFACAVRTGEDLGARELYISACSSRETIAFYKAMGCVPTGDPIREFAEDEPYDLQLVRPLDLQN